MHMQPRRSLLPGLIFSFSLLSCVLDAHALRIIMERQPPPLTPSELVLVNSKIPMTAEAIRDLLRKTVLSEKTEKDIAGLIQQLGAQTFREREEATRRLMAMQDIPLKALAKASRSDDPEVRVRVARVLKEAERRLLRTPAAIFAALRVIEKKKLRGLTATILDAAPSYSGKTTRLAALHALKATVQDSDRTTLVRASKSDKAELKALAADVLRALDGEPPHEGPAPRPTWQGFLGEHLVNGKCSGGTSEFIQIDPNILGKVFKKVKKTADASNSVTSRHDTSRWLYPERGQNECPKVLTENRAKLYPILGSWRQKWNGKWMPLNERGGKINDADNPTGVGHQQSEVAYLVVPEE